MFILDCLCLGESRLSTIKALKVFASFIHFVFCDEKVLFRLIVASRDVNCDVEASDLSFNQNKTTRVTNYNIKFWFGVKRLKFCRKISLVKKSLKRREKRKTRKTFSRNERNEIV